MSVVEQLKHVLADTYALQLKTQNYHWNVEGRHFSQLHALFEEQYDEISEAVDEIAEHIRQLGEKVPASFTAFNNLKSLPDANDQLDEEGMLQSLLDSHVAMDAIVEKARSIAEEADDEVVNDFLITRLAAHRKHAWFLRSSIKKSA